VNTVVLYQSILNEMSEQLDDSEFKLTVLDSENLTKKGAYQNFDFFLLDPVSFLTLRSLGVVGGTLGTLSRGNGSLTTNLMGGVLLMQQGLPTIPLKDIYKYNVAVSSPTI
jgi:hypothetical protein